MMERLDDKFGSWTLLDKPKNGSIKALFVCDCGDKHYVNYSNVRRGLSTQCVKCQAKLTATRMSTHKMSSTALYNVWAGIKRRCYNENQVSYKYYGAKGVLMCDEWRDSFESFATWAKSNNWKKGMAVSRFGDSGNYCPDNCKIQTFSDNAKEVKLPEWSKEKSAERSVQLSSLSQDVYFKVVELAISGDYKSKELCLEYGLDRHVLLGMIKKQGFETNWRKTLLTNDQIAELVAIRFEQNLSTTELGEIFSVSYQCIYDTLFSIGKYTKLERRA